jgi:hypothetical protein
MKIKSYHRQHLRSARRLSAGENDITLVPLHVVKDGADFLDGVTITPADIFAHVAAGGELCSTAAVNVAEYLEIFTPLAAQYDAVVPRQPLLPDLLQLYQRLPGGGGIPQRAGDRLPQPVLRPGAGGGGGLPSGAGTCVDLDELCVQLEELVPQVECSFSHRGSEVPGKGRALLLRGGPGGQSAGAQALHPALRREAAGGQKSTAAPLSGASPPICGTGWRAGTICAGTSSALPAPSSPRARRRPSAPPWRPAVPSAGC